MLVFVESSEMQHLLKFCLNHDVLTPDLLSLMSQATWTGTTMRFLPNLGTKDFFSTWTMHEGETGH